MSKRLLAIVAALSVAGCFVTACDDDETCKTGEGRCENNVSQICSAGTWIMGGHACGSISGCTAGVSVCDGTGSVKVCSESGEWITIICSTFQAGAQCVTHSMNSAGCASPSCTTGQTQCLNGVSQMCNNGAWINGGNACDTMGCSTGQMQCINGISQVCVNGQWIVGGNSCGGCTTGQMQCISGISQVCVNGQWLVGGNACVGCSAGATQCMGGISQICSNGIWVNGGNACSGGACTDGATQCLNGVSQICSSGNWGNGGNACSNNACTTGATQCLNGTSQVCVSGSWMIGGNACNVAACTDGATQCLGGVSQICNHGVWVNGGNACGSGACTDGATQCLNGVSQICSSGAWIEGGNACSVVVCSDGATQCLNGVSMTCVGGGWKTGGSACGGGSCLDGATQCLNGTSQICNNGSWANGGNACNTVVCTDGTSQCLNDMSYICVSGGWVYWSEGDACGSGGTCTTGATQCENNVSQICVNGTWTNGGNACGATEPKAGDPCDESTYPGGCSKDLSKRYYCNSGKLVEKSCNTGTSCIVKGSNSSACENTAPVADCAPGGTEYCNKVCNIALTEGYYYSQGQVKIVSCPNADCNVKDNKVLCGSGGNEELCDANSTKACQKNCTHDGSTGYYWNGTKLVVVDCSENNDCIIDSNNHVVCEGGGSSSETCNKATYEPGCSDAYNGSYCTSQGIVKTVTCTNGQICNNDGGYISCVNNSSTEPQAGAPCDESTYPGGCSKDLSRRYYCQAGKLVEKSCNAGTSCVVKGSNSSICESGSSSETCNKATYEPGCSDAYNGSYCTSTGVVKKVTCTNGQICNNNAGYISCIEDTGTCTYGSYEAHCNGDVAMFCQNNGIIKKQTCGAGQCVHCTDGYTFCNSKGQTCANVETGVDHSVACSGSKRTSGGTDGDCCDIVNYMPACNGTTVSYCSSVGKVKTKSCSNCSVDQSTKKYSCN